jgi:hypothetical protein
MPPFLSVACVNKLLVKNPFSAIGALLAIGQAFLMNEQKNK